MKISYLVTCCDETNTLSNLLNRLRDHIEPTDQIVVVHDKTGSEETYKILNDFHTEYSPSLQKDFLQMHQIKFENDYAAHKNQLIEMSNLLAGPNFPKSDFFFQIDADELPSICLLENLHNIINLNPDVELIYVPRINDFRGVTEYVAKRWGWKLTPSTTIVHEKIIDTNSDEYKFLKENGYILEESKNV